MKSCCTPRTCRKPRYLILLAVLIVAALASIGPIMSDVEIAPYEVEKADGAYEIRAYPDLVVAETSGHGNRLEAMRQGFPSLAAYIGGANEAKQHIAMTAPVLGQSTELGDALTVRFVLPHTMPMAELPAPTDSHIRLQEQPASRYVTIRFSGSTTDDAITAHLEELKTYIATQELTVVGEPVVAFYNPPWTLPFLRRNEIWWQLQDTTSIPDATDAAPESAAPEAAPEATDTEQNATDESTPATTPDASVPAPSGSDK